MWVSGGIILPAVLVAVIALNAQRSRVMVIRTRDGEPNKKTRDYLWDVQSKYPEVINFSDYFLSLTFDRPLTLRGLLIAVALSKFKKNVVLRLLSLILIGAIPFIGYVKIADQPIELFEYFERFLGIYSMGIFASIADAVHHIKPFTIKKGDDALSKFQRVVLCTPFSPFYEPMKAFPRELENIPDEIKMVYPEPFLCELFPDLCLGWGGLKPMQTLRTAKRNELVAELLNKLSANLLIQAQVIDAQELFIVKFGDERIQTVDEFVSKIPGITMCFTKNSSSFGFMVCVKEGDKQYRQLPLAWPGRMAIRDPDTGDQLTSFAYHSSLVIVGNETCPIGPFRTQFFLGPEGLTGWKSGNEYSKPWAPLVAGKDLTDAQKIEASRAATCTACAINVASMTQDLAVGGYALHGTCLDTVAIIKTILFGSFDDFPVVAAGDARAGTIAACSKLAKALSKSNEASWAIDMFSRISNIVETIPDDTVIPPDSLIRAIDRVQESIVGDFVHSTKLRNQLRIIRDKWKKILHSD